MPSILLSDNGVSSGSAGLKTTAGNDGALALQTTTAGGTATNAVLVDNTQNVLVGMASYGVTNAGVSLSPTASSSFYVAGGTAVTIGRGVSDGTAVQFNRSGTNVGTIAVATTGLTMTGTNGITFTATQSASSDANTLDDYEEGTFTPTIGGTSIVYSGQAGKYTKIGRIVQVQGWIYLASGSPTAAINGLPFTASTGSDSDYGMLVRLYYGVAGSVTYSGARTESSAYISRGTTIINIEAQGSGLASTTATVSSTANIYFSAVYTAA